LAFAHRTRLHPSPEHHLVAFCHKVYRDSPQICSLDGTVSAIGVH